MRLKLGLVVLGIFLISFASAVADTAVFQGQYFEGTEFQTGTYEFNFDIYTGEVFGDLVYSDTQTLTTGNWGQWRAELDGISVACNDSTKDYFMEITIDGNVQSPRRRLTHFNYLRKNIDDTTTGDLMISSLLNFLLGGSIQELIDKFVFSKSLEVTGDVNASGSIYSNSKLVCLEDGTNCQAVSSFTDTNASTACLGDQVLLGNGTCISSSGFGGGSGGTSYVSFISTVDGSLGKNDRYLPLGTDSGIATSDDESSWIIGRDLTITGILWNAGANDRTKTSAITLFKSTSNKNSFSATSLSKDIQGVIDGYDNSFNVSFSQGDLAVIKYESGGKGGDVDDLSITLIGTYD